MIYKYKYMGMYGSKIGTPIIRWLIVNAKDILQSVVPYGLNFDSYYIYICVPRQKLADFR